MSACEQMDTRFEKHNTTFHATRAFVRHCDVPQFPLKSHPPELVSAAAGEYIGPKTPRSNSYICLLSNVRPGHSGRPLIDLLLFSFMSKNHNSAKEPHGLAIFHISPAVRISRTSANVRKSRTRTRSGLLITLFEIALQPLAFNLFLVTRNVPSSSSSSSLKSSSNSSSHFGL